MNILFLLRALSYNDEAYGSVRSGLMNSASFIINTLKSIPDLAGNVNPSLEVVIDGNCIEREVVKHKVDMVILEALWCPPYKVEELKKLYPKVKWIVRIHSKTPFLANEGIAMEWIRAYYKLGVTISFNNEETAEDFKRMGINNVYLPNIYSPNSTRYTHSGYDYCKEVVDFGLFGAIRPMKNYLNQAIAAILWANENDRKLRLHINSGRIEQHGQGVLKNLRELFNSHPVHELIEHPWMKHADFRKLVATMDLGLQVSLSESFNIVSADFVSAKVPIVAGKDISWLPSICKVNPHSVPDIKNRIENALSLPRFYIWAQGRALNKYNKTATILWECYIKNLLHGRYRNNG